MLTIPWSDFPSFSQECTLDGVVYRFRFKWNYRGQYWTMDLHDRDQNPILLGVKLVVRFDLVKHYPGRAVPPGVFVVTDPKGEIDRVEEGDMGVNTQLTYFTEAEAEAQGLR